MQYGATLPNFVSRAHRVRRGSSRTAHGKGVVFYEESGS